MQCICSMILRVQEGNEILEFDMEIERDDAFHSIEIHIGEPHKTYGACIHLSIYDEDDEAILNGLQYGPKCSTIRNMRRHVDTLRMLKAGLIYIFRTYPRIKHVSLTDKAAVGGANAKIMLTAKRLLQGKKGWYEEHFGAVPDPQNKSTISTLKALSNPLAQAKILTYLPITTQRTWGTPNDIIEYASCIAKLQTNAILATSWLILRNQIENYERDLIVQTLTTGGTSLKASQKRLLRAVNRKAIVLLNAYHQRIGNVHE